MPSKLDEDLAVSPNRYSHEWAAQVLEEAQSMRSSRRPPLHVQAPRSRAMPNRPVDPAFASRPKIANSLDESSMASLLHSLQQHDGPVLSVNNTESRTGTQQLYRLEQSLDSQSKLVQVEDSPSQPLRTSSSFMGKTWTDSRGTNSIETMPPAPLASEEPLIEPTTPKSNQGDRAQSIVEQSLASSSKLIFLKENLGPPTANRR